MADKMPFKTEIETMLSEGMKSKAVRHKLSQLYKGDEFKAAMDTLTRLTAADATKSTTKRGGAGSMPGAGTAQGPIKGIR